MSRDFTPLLPGKVPMDLLGRLLEKYTQKDERILLGAGIGRDATVIDFGDRLLVAKTDPITFAAEEIGWYVVQVNANDIATTGASPMWFLSTILLPEGKAGANHVEDIFRQIRRACDELGIRLCGGHSEVTLGLDRPIVIGMMLGEVSPTRLVRPDGAKPGDKIFLTKGLAIEGTTVLAREHPHIRSLLNPNDIKRCSGFLTDPGISVVREALTASRAARIHAMHDPTEGGLATALLEMAQASDVGLRIRMDDVPIYPETKRLCDALQLDPLGLLASGALLIAADPEDAGAILRALGDEGIPVREIGEVTRSGDGVFLIRDNEARPMPVFTRDEVARALG